MMQQSVREALLERLRARYGTDLCAVWLVGSQARGDARPFSDIDLLILTRGQSEQLRLFPQGELAVCHVWTLAEFLSTLYAPEGRQAIDWWLLAGNLQHAQAWLDPADILATARRMVSARESRVELYGRIGWDQQLHELAHQQQLLAQATPASLDYWQALVQLLRAAEAVLLIHHGRILPRMDHALLPRPETWRRHWSAVCCLGADPRQIDLGRMADAAVRLVKGLWLSQHGRLQPQLAPTELAERLALLDRIPGGAAELSAPGSRQLDRELLDTCLELTWDAVKELLQREPARLLRQVSYLWIKLEQAGWLADPVVADLLTQARIPDGADYQRTGTAAAQLVQQLQLLAEPPNVVPFSAVNRRG